MLGVVALSFFAFPFCIFFGADLVHFSGGAYLAFRTWWLFWFLYLVLAIPATVLCVQASCKGEWWRPDGGKLFVCVLYGLPVVWILLSAGWL